MGNGFSCPSHEKFHTVALLQGVGNISGPLENSPVKIIESNWHLVYTRPPQKTDGSWAVNELEGHSAGRFLEHLGAEGGADEAVEHLLGKEASAAREQQGGHRARAYR